MPLTNKLIDFKRLSFLFIGRWRGVTLWERRKPSNHHCCGTGVIRLPVVKYSTAFMEKQPHSSQVRDDNIHQPTSLIAHFLSPASGPHLTAGRPGRGTGHQQDDLFVAEVADMVRALGGMTTTSPGPTISTWPSTSISASPCKR